MPDQILPAVVISDIPPVYTAIAEWLACSIYILLFEKRFNRWITALFSAIALASLITVYHLSSVCTGILLLVMTIALAVMFLYIYLCVRGTFKDAGYLLARAFIFAELIAALEWMLEYFFLAFSSVLAVACLPVVYGGLAVLLYFAERRHFPPLQSNTKNLITALLMSLIIFAVSNISFLSSNTPMSGTSPTDIFYIRFLCDFCGMLLLYIIQEQRFADAKNTEIRMMENMLSRQYEEYTRSKENIDLIRRHCHDLKHQIQVIRQETDDAKRMHYLNEIEKDIRDFNFQYHTGSPALDIILTSKDRIMRQENIHFTCMVDGTKLDFIDTMDICSIFGNSLDNAIESLVQLEDREKRLLKLTVFSQNEYLIIKLENYFNSPLIIQNGHFQTTKAHKQKHGIGLMSIRATAEKYGGTVKITTENNWFTLCLLFPLSDKTEIKE